MRPFSSSLLVLLLSSVLCGLAWWQWTHGDFQALLGAPPVPVGERLYPDLDAGDVAEIRVTSATQDAIFRKEKNGWFAVEPWQDRMAPEAAIGIIQFAAGLRCEDYADRDDVDFRKAGFGKKSIRIGLLDDEGRELADFRIGRTTPWMVEVPEVEAPVASVFVQKFDRHHKQHIYIGSGDIGPLFKDDFRFLRDHQPFYFHPAQLRRIQIRSEEGELTLEREKPDSAWRMTKPLELATDPKAIKSLVEGLLSLRATRLSESTELSLAGTGTATKDQFISVDLFTSDKPLLLEILPTDSEDSREVVATASDRPGTVFHLPAKPEAGLVTLANLPLSVNELRDPSLTHLHVPSVVGISILPATASEILISREVGQPWMVTIDGMSQPANEENLYALLQAVTTARAVSFESDAVTDFLPYGLDRPVLALRFLGVDNQVLELRFGMNANGDLFANRLGTPTVMRIQSSFLDAVAIRSHEWRPSLLMSFHRVDLRGIERTKGEEILSLSYEDADESWVARQAGSDVTGDLNEGRARFLLSALEELRVAGWLPSEDSEAAAALVRPTLKFQILREDIGDDGSSRGILQDVLEFAPQQEGRPAFYFGRRISDPHPFLIPAETYEKLSVDLLDD